MNYMLMDLEIIRVCNSIISFYEIYMKGLVGKPR